MPDELRIGAIRLPYKARGSKKMPDSLRRAGRRTNTDCPYKEHRENYMPFGGITKKHRAFLRSKFGTYKDIMLTNEISPAQALENLLVDWDDEFVPIWEACVSLRVLIGPIADDLAVGQESIASDQMRKLFALTNSFILFTTIAYLGNQEMVLEART